MDKRGLLTFALCALVLFAYYTFLMPALFPTPTRAKARTRPSAGRTVTAAAVSTQTVSPAPAAAAPTARPPAAAPAKPRPPQAPAFAAAPAPEEPVPDDIVIETDLYRATWTARGAALKSLVLKRYKALDGKSSLELLKPILREDSPTPTEGAERSRLALDVHSFVFQNFEEDYGLERRIYSVRLAPKAKQIQFSTVVFADEGKTQPVAITKTFTLADGRYDVAVAVEVSNWSQTSIAPFYTISAGTGISAEDTNRPRLEAVVGKLKGAQEIEVVRKGVHKLAKSDRVPMTRCEAWDIRFAGIANKYFAAVLVAEEHTIKSVAQAVLWGPTDSAKLAKVSKDPRVKPRTAQTMATNAGADLRMTMPPLAPGSSYTHRFQFFVGPKSRKILAQYPALEYVPAYGWFGSISRLLIMVMNACYRVMHNYGVSIIILTFLVRLVMHPLSRKTQMSMHRMQKLQPKLNELRTRHKGNKRKQSEEQMKMFREHGVNPMGGCLPMFVQLPIFIALYRGIDLSIELRQAPFMLWITDLSRPDTLCHLPVMLPIVRDTLNILPIIMTISFVVQQRMQPKSADPQQAQQQKMMMFMPIVFGVILYHMPSGLTLYWLTSNLLGILEQKIIKRQLAKMEE